MLRHVVIVIILLAALNSATSFSGPYGRTNCPFTEARRPINETNFHDNCPGGNISLPEYFLYGFLGSFSPDHNGVATIIAGAIPIAVESVNKDRDLLPGYNLCFVTADTGRPETADSMRSMTDMRDSGVDAFVGLEHSCAQEAFLAAAWEVPLISYKCADAKVSNKSLYPTFARTLAPSSKVSKSLIATLKHFNWKKIVVVAENTTSDYSQIEEAFKHELRTLSGLPDDPKIEITATYHIPGDYMVRDKDILDSIIDKSRDETRIYVVLSDINTLIDFARLSQAKGLNDEGKYVILSVEKDEVYDHSSFENFCSLITDQKGVADTKLGISACRSLMILAPNYPKYDEFAKKVIQRSAQAPFDIPVYKGHGDIDIQVPIYAGLASDAVLLLAKGMTKVMKNGKWDPRNGTAVIESLNNMPYESVLGNVQQTLDRNGDAGGSYILLSFQSHMNESMRPVAKFNERNCKNSFIRCVDLEYINGMSIDWITKQPVEEPECGFRNDRCSYRWEVISAIVCICSLTVVALAIIIRHYMHEQKLACLLWKVDCKEIIMPRTSSEYTLQNLRSTINFQDIDLARIASFHPSHHYASNMDIEVQPLTASGPGFYKGNVVYVKKVDKKSIDLTRDVREELIHVREMRHENINPFIGASVDSGNICILTLYCARGSLEDILTNEDLDQVMGDTMFVASLVADLIKGMIYLHDSSIASHGNLKSSNCLVDSRWVLQISDFGLHVFRSGQDASQESEDKRMKNLLWRSPELLRLENPPSQGTQKGDIYSFAIILYEIIGRKGPWGEIDASIQYIVDRVARPKLHGSQIFRPNLKQVDYKNYGHYVIKCIDDCWHEDPESRPDFRFINIRLKDMQSGLKPNIFDNMLAIMEKHANILEQRVHERTKELDCEKKKTEMLLLRMLPKSVAEQLKLGNVVDPESFDSVTIYFSDIVGFTEISASSTPLQVVDLLNDLYSCFDNIIENYDVYKIETIGDAYMVVSGLPLRSNKHAGNIASMALHLLSEIQNFEIRHRPGERLNLRIGIHSGPCVAGVVGHKMPRYCLFGDTVNTASRMESSGEALKIHVSEACKSLLDRLGGYILKERGLTSIKGKGVMKTHWLMGKSRSSMEVSREKSTVSITNPQLQQLQSRVAKVRPYTFWSSGQLLECRSLDNKAHRTPQAGESGNDMGVDDHMMITRACSLDEDAKMDKMQLLTHKSTLSSVFQKDADDESDDVCFNDERVIQSEQPQLNNQLTPAGKPVKQNEILICRKMHGYSWNDLWNGIHRGSLKLRGASNRQHQSIPDYC